VLFVGVLFAAFPIAYGNILSHYYIFVFLLLFSLIFRGASLEFRSMVRSQYLKWFWDIAFWLPSVIIPIIFGMVASGLALSKVTGDVDEAMHSVLVCVCLLSLLTLHGMNFLRLKRVSFSKLNKIAHVSGIFFVITWPWIATIAPITHPLMGVPILFITCFAAFMWWSQNKTVQFMLSWIAIMLVVAGFAMLIYPVIGVSSDITIYDTMSSDATLTRMLMFTVIGLPFVCAYTFMSYRIFWKD
ncbi:MAG: cytochrome d ubiquinol oxidase subunit II, partial [Phycisphaerales bacterium]|nr:cytochrome d ubiquinol oxidase subunit II [Phycisphaerales bacterium]